MRIRLLRRSGLPIAISVAIALTAGCAFEPTAIAAGTGSGTGAVTDTGTLISTTPISTAKTTSPTCTGGRVIADPWIAFSPALHDGSVLTTGKPGWLRTSARAAEVTVAGDQGVVEIVEQSIATETNCGVEVSRSRWIEVHPLKPGRVSISFPDVSRSGGSQTLTITISGA